MAQGNSSQNRASGSPGATPASTPAPDPVGSAADLLKQIVAFLAAILVSGLGSPSKLLKVRVKAARLIAEFLQLAIDQPIFAPKGSDPAALLQEWDLVSRLVGLLGSVTVLRKELMFTVLTKEADIWKTVLAIYNLASAHAAAGGVDQEVTQLVERMKEALATGPKAQKTVHTSIKPTPVKGARAKKALLAAPALEAAMAKAAEAAPLANPESAPKAPATSGSGGGSATGSGQ